MAERLQINGSFDIDWSGLRRDYKETKRALERQYGARGGHRPEDNIGKDEEEENKKIIDRHSLAYSLSQLRRQISNTSSD